MSLSVMFGLMPPTLPNGMAKVYENGTIKTSAAKQHAKEPDPQHDRLRLMSDKQSQDAVSRYRDAFAANRGIATISILSEMMGRKESSVGKWLNANPDMVIAVGKLPDNQRVWLWIGE